jgi:hypothetical protein
LKKGKIISLIEQMKQYKKSVRGSGSEILTSQINYFHKRLSKGLFDYKKISQLNLPIGFNGQAFDVGAEIEDSVGVDAEAGELIGEF